MPLKSRVLTVRVAGALVTEPMRLLTTTSYRPASDAAVLAKERLALVAPAIAVPFFLHCNVGVGTPVAVTLKLTRSPAKTVWLSGPVAITGAVRTISVADALSLPAEFVATIV